MQDFYSSLISKSKKSILLFSDVPKINIPFIQRLIENIPMGKNVLVIDPKRMWKLSDSKHIKLMRPKSIEEMTNSVVSIPMFVSNRIALIVILDYFYYLRDFRGRRATDVAINTRYIGFMNSIIQTFEKQTPTIVVGYSDPMANNNALGEQYFRYYGFEIVKLEKIDDDFVLSPK